MWTSAGCASLAVAGLGKAEENGRVWPSIPGLPASSFTVGGSWEMQQGSMGLVLTLQGGMGDGFIPEDKLDVIALKSRYSGD